MPISGRIAVEVEFLDTASGPLSKTTKTLSLNGADEYTTGKVAIVTGTVGTAEFVVNPYPSAYKDASGNAVSFATITRLAFQASRRVSASDNDVAVAVSNGDVAVVSTNITDGETVQIAPLYSSGTASYTLVLYGT